MKQELETINKKLEAIKAEVDNLLAKETTPEFQIGHYVRVKNAGSGAYVADDKIGKIIDKPLKEPINYNGCVYEEKGPWLKSICGRIFHLNENATVFVLNESEIKEALVAEAEKRGFKEGVRGKYPASYEKWCLSIRCSTSGADLVCKEGWTYLKDGDVLFAAKTGGLPVYCQGQWAEIISEPVVKIGGYEVKFCGDVKPSGESSEPYTTIDGNRFTKEFWQAAKTISEHSKAKIMVGCSKQFDVSLDTINQILKGLK